ncbi:hypothetical protein EMIHUDRAFT_456849, partial [Emiliania huxleyi CCMP1516]|uniref:Uncharacterized protein n=2 Tax=Emiliania huxleyi TaxID=2903 RepID=A0A0D3K007_EMIH1
RRRQRVWRRVLRLRAHLCDRQCVARRLRRRRRGDLPLLPGRPGGERRRDEAVLRFGGAAQLHGGAQANLRAAVDELRRRRAVARHPTDGWT